jgi:hypothetical protein
MTKNQLGWPMRWLLLFCGPMNVVGAICFSPPYPGARQGIGLSEPAPFYLWLLSAWILAFGVAFFYQGWTGRANRGILALATWGKGVFGGMLLGMGIVGELPLGMAAMAGLPDLVLAVVFGVWLWRTRGDVVQDRLS